MSFTRQSQQGIGLVEVLVALVVISLGVLGMAGLQLTGMKQSSNGFNRAKAVMLAESMTTRMRINRIGVVDGHYNHFDSLQETCSVLPSPYCQAYGNNDAQDCDAAQLAAFDKYSVACGEWNGQAAIGGVAGLMPADTRLQVQCNDATCTAESSYTLNVTWPESPNASSNEPVKSSRVQMRLRP
ncbi:MAG: type IV pilus modification protein PilV [Granulosicoccus sp.]